nr:hypothetical protein [Tanacetum cinerariifolium]
MPPSSPILSLQLSPIVLPTTPKNTPPPITTTPLLAPTQPSKETSKEPSPFPITIKPLELIFTTPPSVPTQPSKLPSSLPTTIEPLELVFTTPPTLLHPYFDELDDLPPRKYNPTPLPIFESIKRMLVNLFLL